jgi:hypothetical protein
MRIVLILLRSLVCFLGGGVANAQSPSFDCRKARLPDEFAICHSSQLIELDNLVAAGYVFLKSTQGRPAADQVGIPFWRLRDRTCDPSRVKGGSIDCGAGDLLSEDLYRIRLRSATSGSVGV